MDREIFEGRLDAWRELYGIAKKQLDQALSDIDAHRKSIEKLRSDVAIYRSLAIASVSLWVLASCLLLF